MMNQKTQHGKSPWKNGLLTLHYNQARGHKYCNAERRRDIEYRHPSPEERKTMNLTMWAGVTATIAALATSVFAQLPTTKVLTMDVAQTIAQAAMDKCR